MGHRLRKIEVDGQEWKWLAGTGTVVIRDPDNKKYAVELWKFLEISENEDDCNVTPYDVRKYIKERILK